MAKTKKCRQTGGTVVDDVSSTVTGVANELKEGFQAGTSAIGSAIGSAGTGPTGNTGAETGTGPTGAETGTEALVKEKKWYEFWNGGSRRRRRCTKKHRHSSACKRKSKGRKSYRKRR
jgi:hypothetical protein